MNKKKIKYTALVLLAIVIIIFLVQNAELVKVQLLFWPIEIPRSLLILVSMGIGALGTFIFMMLKKDKTEATVAKEHKVRKEEAGGEVAEW
ncbi:MAG: hypothetical protein Roseis2KO_07060 [Roseivirga sp.]